MVRLGFVHGRTAVGAESGNRFTNRRLAMGLAVAFVITAVSVVWRWRSSDGVVPPPVRYNTETNLTSTATSPVPLEPKPMPLPALPVFASHPVGAKVRPGEHLALQAEATSDAPLELQWLENDRPIQDATNSRLDLLIPAGAVTADYALVAKNAGGAVTSRVATVRVAPALPHANAAWTNTLGIPFVPLPGRQLLVGTWEVRIQDFRQMPSSRLGRRREQPGMAPFTQNEDEPVVMVSWRDATNFCNWLTEQETQMDRLGTNQRYRLPTDEEWSCLAGLPQGTGSTPAERWENWKLSHASTESHNDDHAPLRNVAGVELKRTARLNNQPIVPGHEDGIVYTAKVDSLGANSMGLFHLLGNVSEWCADTKAERRWFRGASWQTASSSQLNPGWRGEADSTSRLEYVGFRLILETAAATP